MILVQKNALEKLETKWDSNEQYIWSSCLRIHGTEFNPNADNDSVMNKMEKWYYDIVLEFNESKIDRPHYIFKPTIDKNTRKKCKSIVVKFKSWKSRTAFYKACPKSYVDRKKKPEVKLSISLDLTKRRYHLMKTARDLTKNNASVSYVFCDANCSLVIKFCDNTCKYFHSVNELKRVLINLGDAWVIDWNFQDEVLFAKFILKEYLPENPVAMGFQKFRCLTISLFVSLSTRKCFL